MTETVKLLMERGANIEDKDIDGHTPLLLAAKWGKTETVKLLIERRANIEAKDSKGRTPLHACRRCGERQRQLNGYSIAEQTSRLKTKGDGLLC